MTPARTRSPADVLPLRSVDFLVLLMLGRGDRHGYGIMQDVLAHTEGRTELEAGRCTARSGASRKRSSSRRRPVAPRTGRTTNGAATID